MSAYVIAVVNKKDLATYQKYLEAGFLSVQGFNPEVTVAEQPQVLEGSFPGTTLIMMKFKTAEEAQRWYDSDLYQKAIPFRHAAGDTPFAILFPGND